MKKLLTIIVIVFCSRCFSQTTYSATWQSSGHANYEVQRSSNNYSWTTIGNVKGSANDSTYSFSITPSSYVYYYRIKADNIITTSIRVTKYYAWIFKSNEMIALK